MRKMRLNESQLRRLVRGMIAESDYYGREFQGRNDHGDIQTRLPPMPRNQKWDSGLHGNLFDGDVHAFVTAALAMDAFKDPSLQQELRDWANGKIESGDHEHTGKISPQQRRAAVDFLAKGVYESKTRR